MANPNDIDDDTSSLAEPLDIENDLACSAWHDPIFATWFLPFAKSEVLVNAMRGEDFFRQCGEFATAHKSSFSGTGDKPKDLLDDSLGALKWFRSLPFPKLPGGKKYKPSGWQIEKARRYLKSRYNTLLSEKLADAEQVRADGDSIRADMLASDARRKFSEFCDNSVPCRRAMDDIDAILALADSNPPLFKLDGEMGRMLNGRLKRDNLGVLLANQKIGKTTTLVSLACIAGAQTPTLLFSAGDETETKLNARISTNLSTYATQREYAGTFAVPIPDCAHNAAGTCPIGMSGEPRQTKCWKTLVADGATPYELAKGTFDGSRAMGGGEYLPCCRCFPKNDGTPEDRERRRNWRSAVWWREEKFELTNRQRLLDTRDRFEMDSFGGGLRVAAYPGGELTVAMINDKLDSLDRLENFVPSTIILDYADLVKQEIFRSTDKDHDGMRMIWEGLRAITFKRDLLLITATQSNRNDVETHTIHTIGRCAKAADNCTWMATLNQMILEKRAKVMRTSMLFAREGGFDPEHQAMCFQWHEAQDTFAFSSPTFCKTKNTKEER